MTPQVPHVRPSCQVRARVSSQRNVLVPSPGQHDYSSLDLVSFGSATHLVTCFQVPKRHSLPDASFHITLCEVKRVTEMCTNSQAVHLENHLWVKHLTQTWFRLNSLLNNNLKRRLPENSEALVETFHAFV